MYWQRDTRLIAGGRWECRIKRAEYNRRRNQLRVDWNRDRYNTDSLHRKKKIMVNAAYKRRVAQQKRRDEIPANPLLAEYLIALRPKGA